MKYTDHRPNLVKFNFEKYIFYHLNYVLLFQLSYEISFRFICHFHGVILGDKKKTFTIKSINNLSQIYNEHSEVHSQCKTCKRMYKMCMKWMLKPNWRWCEKERVHSLSYTHTHEKEKKTLCVRVHVSLKVIKANVPEDITATVTNSHTNQQHSELNKIWKKQQISRQKKTTSKDTSAVQWWQQQQQRLALVHIIKQTFTLKFPHWFFVFVLIRRRHRQFVANNFFFKS